MVAEPTTFGIEEEFVFLDPVTMKPVDVAAGAFETLSARPAWAPITHREFLASQVEHASTVFTSSAAALASLVGFRHELAEEARRLGVVVASVGAPPDAHGFPTVTDLPRYLRIVDEMGGVIADHQIQGLHVHVGVVDHDAGVRALNVTRNWLPLFSALTGNSPIWRGHDTGFDSWRNVSQRRWTTTGCPPLFRDGADYDRRLERLIGIGGMQDQAIIMWNARLSSHVPTIEVRVADAQLEAWSSVLLTALFRALVSCVLDDSLGRSASVQPTPEAAPDPELLNASLMHSAHFGLSGEVLDPVLVELRPAAETLDRCIRVLQPALEAAGDLELARDGVARLLRDGTGAARQRAAFTADGMSGLRELYASTFSASP
ncbi:carboxylate-amine ligase [Agromyces cerinus]|uniref:Putative glutamate--cysteine ligase 2 n=1 Tax=Agromyces cerinus subsp. cerinus TaxID=232089 RepID=A0A1N6F3Y7_9MICO|nr:YbdK family carboxylate-amine ligase [Agromyces cerinus]SIN89992.1 carboxylate-amine ligase [Agromyces cerinus subsp. cerinus]